MSKDRKKVVHIHSNVNDKQPTPATLELGELGVNNAVGNAFISTKNSNNEVVRFSEDGTIVNWMEYKEVIPYEAYVRGSNTATTDVTTDDLANNKSNIVIKLNQVVARNTEYDEKVNGAKDIYGNEINPISADGYKDGAGLAIDMSRYAMIGANPSFSSVTTTCGAELQGKTNVKGSTCGSELNVEVDTIKENATTIDTTACIRNYNNTNDFKVVECTEGQGEAQIKSCKKFNVKSNDIVLEQCGGNGETKIKSCSAITLQSKNIILTDSDCGNGEATFDINDLCLVGRTKMNVYGSETNVGIDCDDNPVANNTNVYGGTVNITATANLCEKGENSYFYGTNTTYIGQGCDGSISNQIIYARKPSTDACGIKATTIDSALDEVLNRSKIHYQKTEGSGTVTHVIWQDTGTCENRIEISSSDSLVSMSAETYDASSEYSKKYTLWQMVGNTRHDIGTIDIPKDHILKDAKLVWGVLVTQPGGTQTFTPCIGSGSEDCQWYIYLVWNVFDPQSGHANDKELYIGVNDLVQDISVLSTDGVLMGMKYNGKQNVVSADTTVKVVTPDNTVVFSKANGIHTANTYKLTVNKGDVKSDTASTEFNPFKENNTITIPTCVSHINRGKLRYTYMGSSESIIGETSGEYDPGEVCDNTVTDTIKIPTSIDNLTNWNGTCINLPHNVCVDGNITANGYIYSSDRNLKENIMFIPDSKVDMASKVKFKAFNYKNDETKTTLYGVIAQEVGESGLSELIHFNDDGYQAVDYTSLMILKLEGLAKNCEKMSRRITELENKINELEGKSN